MPREPSRSMGPALAARFWVLLPLRLLLLLMLLLLLLLLLR